MNKYFRSWRLTRSCLIIFQLFDQNWWEEREDQLILWRGKDGERERERPKVDSWYSNYNSVLSPHHASVFRSICDHAATTISCMAWCGSQLPQQSAESPTTIVIAVKSAAGWWTTKPLSQQWPPLYATLSWTRARNQITSAAAAGM